MIHNRYGEAARGGAERVVERLVGALQGRGHTVEVFHRTTLGFGALGRLPVFVRALWHLVDLCNVIAAVRLRVRLRRTKPDIVHTHNLVGCGGLTPWTIRRSGIPWVHTLHDVQLITPSGLLTTGSPVPPAPSSALERSLLGRWFRSLRRQIFGSPDVVTSPSRWLLQLHRAYAFFPGSRDVVIGNPIAVSATVSIRRGAVRRFCVVGQMEGQKGIFVLVEAYRQLHALFPDVHLHVVGSGSSIPLLKRLSRDIRGLVLRGRLDADGVRAAISESDVLVVPSLIAENQPSVILEAFALGVPVVASRVGGIPELIHDGETGFLVDSGSVEDLLGALRLCVEDPKRMRGMAAACRAVAAAHAGDCIANQLEEVYTDANAYGGTAQRKPMGSVRER